MLGAALLPRGDGLVLAPLQESIYILDSLTEAFDGLNIASVREEENNDTLLESSADQVTKCEPSVVFSVNSVVPASRLEALTIVHLALMLS